MEGGLGRVTKHSEYYIRDGSVSFLTGKTLFRVHQSFFQRESEVFRDLFATAAKEDPQSGSDARPFTLDIKPDDFAQLLWIWYDRDYLHCQQSKENWITILSLANRWGFPKIRELAIRELDGLALSPAERVSIYHDHGVDDDRLLNSYVEICKSPTIPTEEEASLLKMEALINVLEAREDAQRRARKLRQESPTSPGLEDGTLREIVSNIFGTSLSLRPNGVPKGSGVQVSHVNDEHETITLGDPQAPPKKAQSSEEPSYTMSDKGKGNREGEQGSRVTATTNNMQTETRPQAGEDSRKLANGTRDEERKEAERAKQAEKEESKRQQKVNQEKERKKAEEQKPPPTSATQRKTGGKS